MNLLATLARLLEPSPESLMKARQEASAQRDRAAQADEREELRLAAAISSEQLRQELVARRTPVAPTSVAGALDAGATAACAPSEAAEPLRVLDMPAAGPRRSQARSV